MNRLLALILPARALRFDRLHPMTVDAAPLLFEWEQQFYRQHPVVEPQSFATGGPVVGSQPAVVYADDFPLIRPGDDQ